MVYDELPLALPFYDDIRKQNRFKENITNDDIFDLFAENDRLIPFQFRMEQGTIIENIYLLSEEGSILFVLNKFDVRTDVIAGYQYFTWFSDSPFTLTTGKQLRVNCQKVYLKITFTNGYTPLYSELMTIMEDSISFFKIEWRNDIGDIDPVYYGNGFKNRLYSDTFVTKGIPTIEIDSEKNGFGITNIISKVMINNYDFSLMVVPNFIVTAMNFMSIHDNISIRTKDNIRYGKIENVEINQEQVNTIAYFELTVKFNDKFFYFNGSCPTPITPAKIEEIIISAGTAFDNYDLVYDAN